MASPFRIFRKHLKPLMVIFTVLLMIAWAGGSSLTSILNRSGSGANARRDGGAVAVRWDGGSLTNQQVNELVVRRRLLNAFLQHVEGEGAKTAYEAGVEPRPLHVQRLLGPETPQQGVEDSVVKTRLFADAARQAGMRISDESIVQYLDELGRGNVTREQMRAMLTRLQSNSGRITIDDLLASLREDMLARNYVNSNQYAFMTVTPEQRWRDWLRVNDRVVVEAAAIPTESFLVDVKDPTEAELLEFFDKYKEREPSPELAYGTTELPSPTPGFRIPRKIDLQFIEANYDSFLAKAEEKVTNEEIAKYYEEHKDPMFVKADTGLMEDKGEKKDAVKPEGKAPPDAKGANGAPPSDATKPAGEPGSKTTPAPDSPSAPGPATPPATPPDQGKATDDKKPAESGEGQPPAEAGKGDAPAEEKKQSSLKHDSANSVFHLVAFQDADKKDAPAASAAPAAESKTSEPESKPAETSTTPPATATPPAAAAAPPATPAPPSAPAGPAIIAPPAPAPKKPLQFQPLDEVKDLIRRQLAEGKVAEQLNKLAADLENQLDAEFQKYFAQTLSAEEEQHAAKEGEKHEQPAPPKSLTDLAPLAEKNGLKHAETGPMSVLQLRETPVGKSSAPDSSRTLLSMLFGGHDLDLYQPVSTVDLDGNHYIVTKKSDTPGRVPQLAEVKDEVIKAWKKQKAAEAALKHAEEVAKKAQEAKSPLTTFFADDKAIKVARTDPFSELTGGDVGVVNGQLQQQPYRLAQPDSIVAAGPDFMKRVSQLKDGEVVAVLNHDHSIAYVVRLVEHQPPLTELRTAYLSEANSWPGLDNMTRGHAQEVMGNLQNDILAGSNLKWERKYDESDQKDSQDAG